MEFFYVSFRKKIFVIRFNNFIFEENKNIYGNTFIPSKSHGKIGLMKISIFCKFFNAQLGNVDFCAVLWLVERLGEHLNSIAPLYDTNAWRKSNGLGHAGLRTPGEEIAFTAWPKINFHSQIFRYCRSIICLPHWPNFSDFFDLYLHWVSVVSDLG